VRRKVSSNHWEFLGDSTSPEEKKPQCRGKRPGRKGAETLRTPGDPYAASGTKEGLPRFKECNRNRFKRRISIAIRGGRGFGKKKWGGLVKSVKNGGKEVK